jgi:stage III sporulation protein SpoIIIAA
MNGEKELEKLIEILPPHLQDYLTSHPFKHELIEIVLDLGRRPEARFSQGPEYLSSKLISWQDIDYIIHRIDKFNDENRAGIERTLHRISCMRNRQFLIHGLTCRIGRAVFGTISAIHDLLESEKSILILGRPGVGKTTIIREIGRVLADEMGQRVIIIDTSNEIAGNSDIPHHGIGRARRMQVSKTELQHQVMIEAVENHMPQVIIIDEIGTELEVLAARTIAEKGVKLVGTTHGNYIENLIKNPVLAELTGGIQYVTLSDEEAKRRGTQKSILERKSYPTFEIVIEIHSSKSWIIHENVGTSVDCALRNMSSQEQIRQLLLPEKVKIRCQNFQLHPQVFPILNSTYTHLWNDINDTKNQQFLKIRSKYLGVYVYSLSNSFIREVLSRLRLRFILTRDIQKATLIIGLKKHLKQNLKVRRLAEEKQIPIYSLHQLNLYQLLKVFACYL